MLRRLLSNNQTSTVLDQSNNLAAVEGHQQEAGPTAVEEPREYFLLSKMQPHPPSSVPFHAQPPHSAYPPCPYPIPAAHLLQSSCWSLDHQQGANAPPPFPPSAPFSEATDFYWPNFISPTDHFNGFSLPPPLPQIQPTPPHPFVEHFVQNEKIYANDKNGIEIVRKSAENGEPKKEEPKREEGRKTSTILMKREKLESPASSEEGDLRSCPFCSRSPKGGSLRRHMAQCRRLKGIPKDEENAASKRPFGGSPASAGNEKKPRLANGHGQPLSPAAHHSSATVDPSDPYACVWCEFSTLYKGNMKRHLISCHQVKSEILQRLQFDVERLRKLAVNRPAFDELPIRPRRDEGRGKAKKEGMEGRREEEEEFGDEEEEEGEEMGEWED